MIINQIADEQSKDKNREISTHFMGRLGFEPKTIRLKAECSTAELATRCVFVTRFTNVAEETGKCNLFYKKFARIVTTISMVC